MPLSKSLENPRILYATAALAVAVVGLLDHWTGTEISFSIFYLAPVGLVALKGSRKIAVVFAALCAIVWAVIEMPGHQYSHWAIQYWNALVWFGFFVIVAMTLSRLKEQAALERALASTDPLTGVANSRAFYAALEREMERTRRNGRPLTVAYLDLDNFKAVNDERGHLAGDEILRGCALTLRRTLRTIDTVARLGGDEFALVLPETSADAAEKSLTRIRSELQREVKTRRNRMAFTVSIGAVTVVEPLGSLEELVSAADEVMYHVKRRGKNGVRVESLSASELAAAREG